MADRSGRMVWLVHEDVTHWKYTHTHTPVSTIGAENLEADWNITTQTTWDQRRHQLRNFNDLMWFLKVLKLWKNNNSYLSFLEHFSVTLTALIQMSRSMNDPFINSPSSPSTGQTFQTARRASKVTPSKQGKNSETNERSFNSLSLS